MKRNLRAIYSKMSIEELTAIVKNALNEINATEAKEKKYIETREREYNRLSSKRLLQPVRVSRINGTDDLWKLLGYMGTLPTESIVIIACKSDNRVCDVFSCTSSSGVDSATPNSVYMLERSREHNADYIYMAHNHPCGTLKESEEDIGLTKIARKAMETFGIRLKDHLIVTLKNLYSIEQRKVIY
mgnify:CR=1 FL=1